tara:strand:+ start:8964 stop:9206 length:243 start_codon:yes stop_codon:yes gene_type:complete
MTWGNAIKGFLIALPELVKLIRPVVEFFTELLGPDPSKKAKELGDALSHLAQASRETDLKEKEKKKDEGLEKLSDFFRSN